MVNMDIFNGAFAGAFLGGFFGFLMMTIVASIMNNRGE